MKNSCVLPFNSLSITSSGALRACCGSGSGVFDANVNTSNDILNYEQIVNLRKAFLNDEKPAFCNKCWETEDLGAISDRVINLVHYKHFQNPQHTIFQENIDFINIQHLDLDLGNKCNLACRMCNPSCSTLIASHYAKFVIPAIDVKNAQYLSDVGYALSNQTKQHVLDILDKSPNLESLAMIGGEPLIIDFHDQLLEKLISLGVANKVKVRISTNLQSDIDRKIELYKHFKTIDLSISVDGSENTYEYIRWPGRWSKIVNNINIVKEHNKTYNNITYSFTNVVQNLNIDNLHEFILEIEDLSMGQNGPYFHISQRNNEIEIVAKHILEKTLEYISNYNQYQFFQKDRLINILQNALVKRDNLDPLKVKRFFHLQQEFDNLRGQNLFELKPHFIELAEAYSIPTW